MSYMKTNTVAITVGNRTYHSLSDFGLAIGNTDYIGQPVQPRNIVLVPGRLKPLDLTDGVFGGQYFTHRPISIRFGAVNPSEDWDSVMSNFRNLFDGQTVKLTFANDPDYYWTGRAQISSFERKRALGQFLFEIPYADPYKYKQAQTTYTVIPASIGKSQTCVNSGRMTVTPTFQASAGCTLAFGSITKQLEIGYNTFPDVVFPAGNSNIILTGTTGEVIITYREGSL